MNRWKWEALPNKVYIESTTGKLRYKYSPKPTWLESAQELCGSAESPWVAEVFVNGHWHFIGEYTTQEIAKNYLYRAIIDHVMIQNKIKTDGGIEDYSKYTRAGESYSEQMEKLQNKVYKKMDSIRRSQPKMNEEELMEIAMKIILNRL